MIRLLKISVSKSLMPQIRSVIIWNANNCYSKILTEDNGGNEERGILFALRLFCFFLLMTILPPVQ